MIKELMRDVIGGGAAGGAERHQALNESAGEWRACQPDEIVQRLVAGLCLKQVAQQSGQVAGPLGICSGVLDDLDQHPVTPATRSSKAIISLSCARASKRRLRER